MPVSKQSLLRKRSVWLAHSDSQNSCESTICTSPASPKRKVSTPAYPQRPLEEKHVSFDQVQIRSYQVIMGDHPCCQSGCPISLGWQYEQQAALSLDHYEHLQEHHRHACPQKIPIKERHYRLLEQHGSEREIRHKSRHCYRHRDRRTQQTEQAMFFHLTDCSSDDGTSARDDA